MPPVSNLDLLMDSSRMRWQLKMVSAVVCELKSFMRHMQRHVFFYFVNPQILVTLYMDDVFTDTCLRMTRKTQMFNLQHPLSIVSLMCHLSSDKSESGQL